MKSVKKAKKKSFWKNDLPMFLLGVVSVFAALFIIVAGADYFARRSFEVTQRTPEPTHTPQATPRPIPAQGSVQDVPFAAQAPFGDWSDPVQQDGCEEASVIMAMRWVNDEPLTQSQMLTGIYRLASWSQERFGTYHDTSIQDTLRYVTEYYGYGKAWAKTNVTLDEIKREVYAGNLVLTPMDGRLLDNPHYTSPGPAHHFMLIKGYDDDTKEFITNDPGTRYGESYRYGYTLFYSAIRDYPTGWREPITGVIRSMIVVEKE